MYPRPTPAEFETPVILAVGGFLIGAAVAVASVILFAIIRGV